MDIGNEILIDSVPSQHNVFKTFTYLNAFSSDALAEGICRGRNMGTSGPLLWVRVKKLRRLYTNDAI